MHQSNIKVPERKLTRQVKIGGVTLGGDAPVRIQSMTTARTRDVEATVDQIQQLTEAGCELVRVACPTEADAKALGKIKSRIKIPLIADIHFNYRFALIALDEGVDKLRLNPGNIGKKERTVEIVEKAKKQHVPIRIGVNGGSLEKDLMEKFGPTPEALVESAKRHVQILEELDFHDIIISLKASDVPTMVAAYRLASQTFQGPGDFRDFLYPVFLAAALHQLEIVHNDESEVLFSLQTARFSANLHDI